MSVGLETATAPWTWANALDLTAEGLLGLAILAVLAGWLIPRWVHTQLTKEVEYLRTALRESESRRTEAMGVATKALSAVEKFETILNSIRPEAPPEKRGDDDVAV